MTFEGGRIPPAKVPGKEGYFLNKDGGLGDYFIEASGQTNRMLKIGANVWTYTTPAMAQELVRLGFPKDASAQHVVVKVITNEQGVETHRISRLTTVQWKAKEGEERALTIRQLAGPSSATTVSIRLTGRSRADRQVGSSSGVLC